MDQKIAKEKLLQIAMPILFNTEMITVILKGNKTVTRRILKLPNHIKYNSNDKTYTLYAEGTSYTSKHLEQFYGYINPLYKQGDILYVKETFCLGKIAYGEVDTFHGEWYVSQLKDEIDFIPKQYCLIKNIGIEDVIWKPSIHMLKKYARIFLKVTNVTIERLQEIKSTDCFREGVITNEEFKNYDKEVRKPSLLFNRFIKLWDSTLKKDAIDKYSWDKNPYVFVYEFEVISIN